MNHDSISSKSHFDDRGFVFCKEFCTIDQISQIKLQLARLIKTVVPSLPAEQVFYENKSDLNSLKQIQKLHEHDDFFQQLMTGAFRDLAEVLLASEVTCENLQYFNKPPGIGQPTPAHQDGYYFKLKPCEAVTMWLALEPVDEENGCVRYVPHSHQRGLRSHGKTGTLGFSQGIVDFPNEVDAKDEIGIPAMPGDLLAHHALTIHRADANRSSTRSRRALGFIYYSVNAKRDVKAWETYQAELKQELIDMDKI